mmetsp:Transcript_26761/g.41868  ORF Transcript_26761/g.41868 Transcript_26761/m.41868 type:complete len:160 (-) Transcript_26761:98-577(-)|eukprot:CAMPEP_0184326940 /NCGR_PEP_ID=MMETSP1049-20130417/142827_1 /TAXON_ID=77928 /ORGANISM="Proteomonas sulcata, Strain CCMP704" /LENGTH=159 /DNA_ID=CAMNT_0026649167 /DNA_START=906 /DNA_END=1385 /DNA_ORIENTATION=+
MSKSKENEPSLERAKYRTKGLADGEDDVRVFFKDPYNVRGKDRLLCFVSEHTKYPFVVVYNDAKWNLEKRFSEFAELDSRLDELYKNDDNIVLPEFPPKKLFGSLSPALIKERQEKLEKYMKALTKDKEVLKCRALREFLETPDVVGQDKHKEFDFGRR